MYRPIILAIHISHVQAESRLTQFNLVITTLKNKIKRLLFLPDRPIKQLHAYSLQVILLAYKCTKLQHDYGLTSSKKATFLFLTHPNSPDQHTLLSGQQPVSSTYVPTGPCSLILNMPHRQPPGTFSLPTSQEWNSTCIQCAYPFIITIGPFLPFPIRFPHRKVIVKSTIIS